MRVYYAMVTVVGLLTLVLAGELCTRVHARATLATVTRTLTSPTGS